MRRRLVAALISLVLLGTGACAPTGGGGPTPVASGPSPAAASRQAVPSAARVATTSADVAGFDLSRHAVQGRYTSPDRTTGSSEAVPDGFAAPPPGRGRKRYLDQKIRWEGCGTGLECGTVLVPLDWDRPDGQAITLRMKRRKATRHSTATLFVNPGGPGGSGQEMVDTFDSSSFPTHDVIGWDPRGSGESTPVRCGSPEQTDAFLATDTSPDDESEWREAERQAKAFAAQCRAASGALLDHISTIDNVRDLDYLRFLVGDQKLDYLGISYGTWIGALYAELYPQRTGRMVLDSAVNITTDESVIQAMGFDLALGNFAQWCAEQSCSLGSSKQQVIDAVTGLLTSLDSRPLRVGGRSLTQSLGVTGLVTYLYFGSNAYQQLATAIEQARRGDGRALMLTADMMNGRNDDGSYGSMTYSFPAIACADAEDPGAKGVREELARDVQKAPLLGPFLGANLQCAWWSAKPAPQLKAVGKGAAPIVVLGATGDPATPYQQAVWMADQLASGVLVTWKGAGHSAWDLGNQCVKDAVRGYVNDGVVPKDRTTC